MTSALRRGSKKTSAPKSGAARHPGGVADDGGDAPLSGSAKRGLSALCKLADAPAREAQRLAAELDQPVALGAAADGDDRHVTDSYPPVSEADLSWIRESSRIRDRGALALSALARSLGTSSRSPTTEQVRETLAKAAELLRATPFEPHGPGDGGATGLVAALAASGTHPTAHWHARMFLSALHGRNVGADPPRSRPEALKLLREADKALSKVGPKRRGGWSVSSPPRPIPIAELIAGPVDVPMPIELMPKGTPWRAREQH